MTNLSGLDLSGRVAVITGGTSAMHTTRREFLATVGSAAVASLGMRASTLVAMPLLRWGYAAITWGDKNRQAIDDIAALGYAGIQLRANALQQFGAAELRELLETRKLSLVALSSGSVPLGPETDDRRMIEDHVAHARFVRDAGGSFLQVTDEKPTGRTVTAGDIKRLGRLLTEIGKRTSDLGITLGYHNHMGTIGEKPDDVDRILEAADPMYVRFELDIAHYRQGGGNPVEAIRRHASRLLFLHIKDVRPTATGYRFVELGRGTVDIKGVLDALGDTGFSGWAVIELDEVPPSEPPRTAKECAAISKRYVETIR